MKKLLLMPCLVIFTNFSFSQSFFEVKEVGSNYTLVQLETAFGASDFCGSFYFSKRNQIILDDGSIVELKFKQEIINEGINSIDESCYMDDNDVFYEAIWSIGQNGHLMKGFDTEKYPSLKEYKHINN